MAFPVIVIDSGSGSDTTASGAGPGDGTTGGSALSGTSNAATDAAGTTVTLPAGTDLSAVATDGSHVIFLSDSTAGARNFGKITGSAGSGGSTPTVTVSAAFGINLTSKTWAIGGKRATLCGTTSYKLITNNAAAGDAAGGWVIELQSGYTETVSARVNIYSGGDTTNGPFILRGKSGAATKPVLTINGADFVPRGAYTWLKDFTITGNSGFSDGVIPTDGSLIISGIKVSGYTGNLIDVGNNTVPHVTIMNCELSGGTHGINLTQNTHVIGNWVYGQSGNGIHGASANYSGLAILNNRVTGCGGCGISITQARTDIYSTIIIDGNTIDSCTLSGILYDGDNNGAGSTMIMNNILSNNGNYGLKFNNSQTVANINARTCVVAYNDTYSNTSGAYLPASLGTNDPAANPTYNNAAGGDYTPTNAALQAGYP